MPKEWQQEVLNEQSLALKQHIEIAPFRWSQRERRTINCDDYYTFLRESDFNIRCMLDLENYNEAISSEPSNKPIKAMNNETLSINQNDVKELVELPNGFKRIGWKWLFKIKRKF